MTGVRKQDKPVVNEALKKEYSAGRNKSRSFRNLHIVWGRKSQKSPQIQYTRLVHKCIRALEKFLVYLINSVLVLLIMRILNRRAKHDYYLFESFEAGVSLTGAEVKSIKQGRADLSSAFVRIRDGETWLVGANIPIYGPSSPEGYDPLRTRKLLLHKRELVSLGTKTRQERLTLVPLSLYTKGRLVKVQVALARGKKKYEKREAKRRKDIERETERSFRG